MYTGSLMSFDYGWLAHVQSLTMLDQHLDILQTEESRLLAQIKRLCFMDVTSKFTGIAIWNSFNNYRTHTFSVYIELLVDVSQLRHESKATTSYASYALIQTLPFHLRRRLVHTTSTMVLDMLAQHGQDL